MAGLLLAVEQDPSNLQGAAVLEGFRPRTSNDADPNADPRQAEIERAVERGLQFLAATQTANGCWIGDLGHKQGDGYMVYGHAANQSAIGSGHLGVTAASGLAFLAAGHVPGRGRFAQVMERTLDYVLRHGEENGYLRDARSRMYSHAFGTLFLAQAYGMTAAKPAQLEERLRTAVQLIVEAQTDFGAWRYTPYTREGDLSVTVCQLQALRAARYAGITVPSSTIDHATDYVLQSRISGGPWDGAFYYKIRGSAAYSKTSFAINAAAITTLHSAGLYRTQDYARALDFIEGGLDEILHYYRHHYYYWYGNYYAAQAMHCEGGERWQRFWRKLRDDLLEQQDPRDGRWRNDVGPGDAFGTAMACLILQVPAAYLPIFQK
jgi:hypothetical protein